MSDRDEAGRFAGRNRCLGYFDTREEAEAAYNDEAKKLRGNFAHHLSGSRQ